MSAFNYFKKKNFLKAASQFNKFRKNYSNSDLNDDALYYLAYIHFLNEDYSKATLNFFELIEQFPKSNKLNESIWWLAVALEKSGDIGGAIDMYKKLLLGNPPDSYKLSAESKISELNSEDTQ